jgi:hypothetical protein
MQRLEKNPLRLSRAGIVMIAWGLLILGAGVYNQYYFPSMEHILTVWGVVSVLGLAIQGLCEIRDQRINFLAWVAVVVLGWAFTLYAIYATNYQFFGHISGVWLILLGLAYIPTALQIDRRYWLFAALHFIVGSLMEQSALKVLSPEMTRFFDTNSPLLFGLVAGGSLLAAHGYGTAGEPASESEAAPDSSTVGEHNPTFEMANEGQASTRSFPLPDSARTVAVSDDHLGART